MFREYARLHHESPMRELVFFHTSRETLDIYERQAFGLSSLTESYNAAYADDTPEEIEEERRLLQGMKRKARAVFEP